MYVILVFMASFYRHIEYGDLDFRALGFHSHYLDILSW